METQRKHSGISRDIAQARARANDFVNPTRRGVPHDYDGSNQYLCNADTQSGRPCRAMGLAPNGRCKWHGGKSTGPRTAEGKARSLRNLEKARKQIDRLRYKVLPKIDRARIAAITELPNAYDPTLPSHRAELVVK